MSLQRGEISLVPLSLLLLPPCPLSPLPSLPLNSPTSISLSSRHLMFWCCGRCHRSLTKLKLETKRKRNYWILSENQNYTSQSLSSITCVEIQQCLQPDLQFRTWSACGANCWNGPHLGRISLERSSFPIMREKWQWSFEKGREKCQSDWEQWWGHASHGKWDRITVLPW